MFLKQISSHVALSGGAMNHWTSQVVAMALKLGIMQLHLKRIVRDLGVRAFSWSAI